MQKATILFHWILIYTFQSSVFCKWHLQILPPNDVKVEGEMFHQSNNLVFQENIESWSVSTLNSWSCCFASKFFISSYLGSSVGSSCLHKGQLFVFDNHGRIHFSWNMCLQGNCLTLSPIMKSTWHIGQEQLSTIWSAVIVTVRKDLTTSSEAGGAWIMSNAARDISSMSLGDKSNLASSKKNSGLAVRSVSSCSSKYDAIFPNKMQFVNDVTCESATIYVAKTADGFANTLTRE